MAEPISVEVARGRLGIVSTHRDAEIADLIKAAREHVEDLTSVTLVSREVREFIGDTITDPYILTSGPVCDLIAIDYTDAEGVEQSISNGRLVKLTRGHAIKPAIDASWPSDGSQFFAVMQAGHAGNDADPYPPKLIQAMLVLVAHWFDDPQGLKPIPSVVADLCYQARTWSV